MTGSAAEAGRLVEETYSKVHRAAASCPLGSELKVWLYRTLTDTFLRETAGPQAHAEILRALSGDDVKRAIRSLPEQLRILVLLGYVEHLSYQEMAQILDVPVAKAVSRLHRGRRALQTALFDVSSGGASPTGNS